MPVLADDVLLSDTSIFIDFPDAYDVFLLKV